MQLQQLRKSSGQNPVRGRCASRTYPQQCLLTCNSESGLAPIKFKSRSEERQNTQKLAVMVRLLWLRGRFLSAPPHVSWPSAVSRCALYIRTDFVTGCQRNQSEL